MSMFIGKSKMDERGRFTLPKSFRDANNISSTTEIYFLPLANSHCAVKAQFCFPKTDLKISADKLNGRSNEGSNSNHKDD